MKPKWEVIYEDGGYWSCHTGGKYGEHGRWFVSLSFHDKAIALSMQEALNSGKANAIEILRQVNQANASGTM